MCAKPTPPSLIPAPNARPATAARHATHAESLPSPLAPSAKPLESVGSGNLGKIPAKKLRVVIYARVSTDEQTVEPQVVELRKYARERRWAVVAEVGDTISGAKITREGLDRVMGMVRRGEVDVVAVVKIDRLARSLQHFAQIIEELRKHRVALVVPGQGIDTANGGSVGKVQMGMLAVIAEFEREIISERTKAGLAVAKANGVRLGKRSVVMVKNSAEVVAFWKGEVPRASYRELARRLGGVSISTAFTLGGGGGR